MTDLEYNMLEESGSSSGEAKVWDEVKANTMWKDAEGNPSFVHFTYNYKTDEALVDGFTAAELMEKMELKDDAGEDIDVPEIKEIKMLRTTCKKTADGEYAVRAILRYVPEVEATVTTEGE